MADHDIEINAPGSSGVINDLRTIFALIQQIRAAGRGTGVGIGGGPGGLGGVGFGPAGRGRSRGVSNQPGVVSALLGGGTAGRDITKPPPTPPDRGVFERAIANADKQFPRQAGVRAGGTAAKIGQRLAGQALSSIVPRSGRLMRGLTGKIGLGASILWAGEALGEGLYAASNFLTNTPSEEEVDQITHMEHVKGILRGTGGQRIDLQDEFSRSHYKALMKSSYLNPINDIEMLANELGYVSEVTDAYLKERVEVQKQRMYFKSEEQFQKFLEAHMTEFMRDNSGGSKRKIMLHDAQSSWYQERFVTGPHRDDVGGS